MRSLEKKTWLSEVSNCVSVWSIIDEDEKFSWTLYVYLSSSCFVIKSKSSPIIFPNTVLNFRGLTSSTTSLLRINNVYFFFFRLNGKYTK